MRKIVREYVDYYHTYRPHRGLEQNSPLVNYDQVCSEKRPEIRLEINTVHDNRVSNRVDNRILDDYPKFILEHEKIVEKVDCVYLNTKLPNMWRQLLKAGRKKEAKMFEKYLILKKIKYKKSLVEKVNDKIKNKWLLLINHFIKMMKEDSTYYI